MLFGLIAAAGLQLSEATRLDDNDIGLAAGLLTIRDTKFGKSRQLPLHPTTVAALRCYATERDILRPRRRAPAFFVSATGTRLIGTNVRATFRELIRSAGIGAGAATPPRIHGLRHYADGWVMCPAVVFPLLVAAEPVLQSA